VGVAAAQRGQPAADDAHRRGVGRTGGRLRHLGRQGQRVAGRPGRLGRLPGRRPSGPAGVVAAAAASPRAQPEEQGGEERERGAPRRHGRIVPPARRRAKGVSGPQDYPARAMAGERVPEPDRARLDAATAGLEPPFAVVDLDAYDANAADLLRRAGGKPLRLASKSVRCRALQDRALDAGFRGQLCFTLPEALWLAGHGARDLLVAYPTTDRTALRALAHGEHAANVTVMVDAVAHLDLIESAAAGGAPVRVAIDVDASWRALGGPPARGRPPLAGALGRGRRGPGPGDRRAPRPAARRGDELRGPDRGAGRPPARPAVAGRVLRAVQRASARELAARRAAVVAAVRAVAPLELVNGGGTGSVEATAAEAAVTEVTAGSGLYGPTLFGRLSRLPAPARRAVRPPRRAAPPARGGPPCWAAATWPPVRRAPTACRGPSGPAGCASYRREGAGRGPDAGRRRRRRTPWPSATASWLRHAKAGELCERFAELHLVRGDRVVGTVPTIAARARRSL
jgi:D-serine deaminase-like pyridoxal phosphate-dependent protein